MDEEDRVLYPHIEKLLARLPAEESETASSRLHEAMTVNRVIHDFPKARKTLENLFVNVPDEGYHCLDEVAWRHGMEPSALLQALEGAISSPQSMNAV